jgi:hypothetical protein
MPHLDLTQCRDGASTCPTGRFPTSTSSLLAEVLLIRELALDSLCLSQTPVSAQLGPAPSRIAIHLHLIQSMQALRLRNFDSLPDVLRALNVYVFAPLDNVAGHPGRR